MNVQITEKSKNEKGWVFEVRVGDGVRATLYRVRVPKEYWEKLTGAHNEASELVGKSFQFLLERESKESILREFWLPVIQAYFPEYETEIRKMLSQT